MFAATSAPVPAANKPNASPVVVQSTSGGFIDVANLPANLAKAAVVLLFGTIQGYLMALAGMFSPATFRSQMRFETFILMKMFVSALGSSMVVQSLLFDTAMPQKWNIVRSYRRVSMGFPRVVGGCALIGAGMAICGCGPTMMGVQLGMGTGTALYIFVGMLVGAGLFQWLEPVFGFPLVCWKGENEKTVVEDYFNDAVTVDRDGNLTAAGKAGKSAKTGKAYLRYRDIALPAGVVLLLMAVALEYVFPHADDLKVLGLGPYVTLSDSAFLTVVPSMAGAFIGLNQIVTRLVSSDGQGGSRSLVQIVSTVTGGFIGGRFKLDSFAKAWQFLHVYGGTFIGGYLAYLTLNSFVQVHVNKMPGVESVSDLPLMMGFSPMASFFGALLVGFGGRLAGGCTCGHGVSGASELCVQSLAGAAAIFAGGIVTALVFGLSI